MHEIPLASDVMLREIGYKLVSEWYRARVARPPETAEQILENVNKLMENWDGSLPDEVHGPPSAAESVLHVREDIVSRAMWMLFHLKRMSDSYLTIPSRDRSPGLELDFTQAMLRKIFMFVWGLNNDTGFGIELASLQRLQDALFDVVCGENNRLLLTGGLAADFENRRYSERKRVFLRAIAAAEVELLVVHKVEKGPVRAARRVGEAMTRGGYTWEATKPEETVRKWHRKLLSLERKLLTEASEDNPVELTAYDDWSFQLFTSRVLLFDRVRRVDYGVPGEPLENYNADKRLSALEQTCRRSRLPGDLGN